MYSASSMRVSGDYRTAYTIRSVRDLKDHFLACSRNQLSGRLDLSIGNDPQPRWSFFLRFGRFVWSSSELHSLRRWNRQLLQYCPQLATSSFLQFLHCPHPRDYELLVDLIKQGRIQSSHLSAIVSGTVLELLFDVIQTLNTQLALSTGQSGHPAQPLEMQLTYQPLAPSVQHSAFLSPFEAERVWQQAEQAWSIWQQWGLESVSPNLAPVIWDNNELRQQTSLLTYHNLITLANGCWTLRDLAINLKQPLVLLTRSLMPYVKQDIMGLNSVGDIRPEVTPTHRFLIAYIEDSRFDSTAMSQILDQAGHRFVSISDPLQAVPTLLEQKPDLIFLDLLMPIANGYEVCTQLRRTTAFKDTPVVILTSSDGIVDRVRAKLAGASGFLSKPIEQGKVLDALNRYLPGFSAEPSRYGH